MTIEEAIKYLAREPALVRGLGMQKRIDAIKLGVEALKFIIFWNDTQLPQHQIYLLDETEK